MPLQNGQLPDSELAPIPGGRLDKEAAANWLAVRRQGGQELGIWISPLGPVSSYRPLATQQVFWNLFQAGRGNLAAVPGTSNHGWGKAVDLAAPASMRLVIDRFGAPYGWRWGEAPSERWHVTYYGGGRADAKELDDRDHRSFDLGDTGDDIRGVQVWLSRHGFNLDADGTYGEHTSDAVTRLYRAWGHEPHGRFGDVGWSIVEARHPWRFLTVAERGALADLYSERRIAKRNGGWEQVDPSHRANADARTAWLVEQRKAIWRAGHRDGWREHHRRRRYLIIKSATT